MLTETVCVALSAAGLAVSVLTAWRRRFLAATRLAAWSLLPVGLYLTGLVPLGGKIGKAIGTWAAGLVFKPSVGAGVGVLALSVVLFVVTRVVGRRSGGRRAEAVTGAGGPPAVAPKASTAALGTGRGAKQSGGKTAADDGLSDFKEIEEILRRRGI